MAAQIAGKYLADVDPSKAMASAKIEGKIKGLSPGRAMMQANPRLAFGASEARSSTHPGKYGSPWGRLLSVFLS